MSIKIKFIGNGKEEMDYTLVHFDDNIMDFTLCGITLDGDNKTAGEYELVKGKVTCKDCINIVDFCKGIKKTEYLHTKNK